MVGLFLASVALGLLVFAFQQVQSALEIRLAENTSGPEARERVYTVSLIRPEEETVSPVLRSFGEVTARRKLELRSAVAGRIITLSAGFEEGGEVKAGEVLLRIDPSDARSEVDRLSADLADARAETKDAAQGLILALDDKRAADEQAALRTKAFDRQSDLARRGVGTAAAVETAELAAAAARAGVISRRQAVTQAEARVDLAATRLSRAEIALAEAKRRLEDTTIEAPFDGTLSDTTVVAGGLVGVNEKLADLVDPEDLEVAFRVSTTEFTRLLGSSGDLIRAPVTASLDVSEMNVTATGEITRVSAGPGEGQTGRLLFAKLDYASGLRPGDFVVVDVHEQPLQDVIRLPATALDGAGEVLVVSGENRLDAYPVQVLRRQGDAVIVRAPGIVGKQVVRQRTPYLGPGVAVKPRPEHHSGADQVRLENNPGQAAPVKPDPAGRPARGG